MVNIQDFNNLTTLHSYPVMVNGKLSGYVENNIVERFVESLKLLKIKGKKIPK